MPLWLLGCSWLSIGLGALTAAAIARDVAAHPPRMAIMTVVWPVTGLYMPVAGWWIYRQLGRSVAADAPRATRDPPFWQSVVLSATHCGAGCGIGDVIGAPLVTAFGWTLFGQRLLADYAAEFTLAYALGIAFQYVPIRAKGMGSARKAIADAVKADTLSLAAYEVGMFGWMAIATYGIFGGQSPDPASPVFWLLMQIGMLLGFATTYPANWLLIRTGIKGGM